MTSLARLGGDYVAVERHLLRNLRRYACREAVTEDSIWNSRVDPHAREV